MRARRVLTIALLASVLCAAPAGARQLPGFTTGFTDPFFESSSPSVRELWLGRAASEYAGVVRLNLAWSGVVHAVPATDAQAADPSWAGYDFSGMDSAVRDATAAGLQVLLTLTGGAPPWAEGPGRPARALAGTWKPRPDAYAAFARAVALRYSGSYTPPGASAPLPRVRYWEAWNEPNLSIYLTPQWVAHGKGYALTSPSVYRKLLNALYGAVKGVDPHALVVAAGTAPYGDLPGGQRMPPAQFVRNVLCLDEAGERARPCPEHARFDILDHHPYAIEGPYWHALNRDDVSIADMGKLIGPLRRAEHLRLVGGARYHQVWVTEVSWDSSPPNPRGVPIATQARWLEQAFQLLWHEGVSTVLWYLMVDRPEHFAFGGDEGEAAGVYFLDGRPKPSATAFRFPFLANPARRSRTLAWGRAPSSGAVTIERRGGSVWRVVRTLHPSSRAVFQARLPARRGTLLRARQGGEVSLVWRVQ
ncbi:MAG: hypothetical protein ACYDA6_10035 [Solirubrobacteraceae bacterium]